METKSYFIPKQRLYSQALLFLIIWPLPLLGFWVFFEGLGFWKIGITLTWLVTSLFFLIRLYTRLRHPLLLLLEDKMIFQGRTIYYQKIKEFLPSRGGSEPAVITHQGDRLNISLSTLSKQDLEDAEKSIRERMGGSRNE